MILDMLIQYCYCSPHQNMSHFPVASMYMENKHKNKSNQKTEKQNIIA